MNDHAYLDWLIDTGDRLRSTDGKVVQVWELRHATNQDILSAWAGHLRNHYCRDSEIDYLRQGYGCSRADYLNAIKLPDAYAAPGPSIRAGDFCEVLVADYLEYVVGYWVPRTRYSEKAIRNESVKGCDTIGFRLLDEEGFSPDDMLAMFEAKTQFSGATAKPRLQDAVEGSAKDQVRKAESLNAIKQRLSDTRDAGKVARFQNQEDRP